MAPIEGMNGLEADFMRRLTNLINSSGGKIYIVSGFRDQATQQQLWNDAVAKYGEAEASTWVARPGTSNHQRGIAADIGGDLAYAHANAARFGLFFPMSWEDWHIEPVNGQDMVGQGSGSVGQYDPNMGYSVPPEPVDPVDQLAKNIIQSMGAPTATMQIGVGTGLAADAPVDVGSGSPLAIPAPGAEVIGAKQVEGGVDEPSPVLTGEEETAQ